MKRTGVILLTIVGLLIATYAIARITGAWQEYRVSTPSSEPTLERGSVIFASNLKTPAFLDHICYKTFYAHSRKEETVVKRICGMGGDTVEIIAGELFVNSVLIDTALTLYRGYLVDPDTGRRWIDSENIDVPADLAMHLGDLMLIHTRPEQIAQLDSSHYRPYIAKDSRDEIIEEQYGESWNTDYFGPVVVPTGQFFVLGDNRNHSRDSRHDGFVKPEDVVGVVLFK